MRTSVRLGQMAFAVLAVTASLAAQGRTGGRDDRGRAEARPHEDARLRQTPPAQIDNRRVYDNHARAEARTNPQVQVRREEGARVPDRAHAQPPMPVQERPRVQGRGVGDDRWRTEARPTVTVRGLGNERGRTENRGRGDDRPRVFNRWEGGERWRGESRWREDHARIAFEFFASPRYYYAPRYAYASLPPGWEDVIYADGFFPEYYDQWMEPVPLELEYRLPPVYRGYQRFLFGGRLIVIDRLTRSIVMVVRI